jgi:GAF domain-containing protein
MPISRSALRSSIDALTNVGEMPADQDLDASLDQVVHAALVLFATKGAGLMLVDDAEVLHYVSASDPTAAALEEVQERLGEGPCVESLINDEVVRCNDIETDPRWPTMREEVRPLRLRAILGLPVRIGGSAVGSLNVYHHEVREWDDDDVNAIGAYGRVIEELLAHALLARKSGVIVAQLTYALENRVDIERAVGVLMARHHVNAVKAFDLMRREARSSRRKVSDLAREILRDPTLVGD